MRQGRVFKRCKKCAAGVPSDSRRCAKCGSDALSWAFQVDVNQAGEPRKQVQRSGLRTRSDAVAAMREAQQRAESGDPEPTRMTVADWLVNHWLPSTKGRIRASSWVSYESAVRRQIVPRIGSLGLQRLTRAQVKAAYADMESSGLSPKTVHNVHMALRKALADAVEDGLVTKNAADRAHSVPSGSRPEMRTWDASQVRAFLDHVRDDRLYPLWRLLVTTGMRRGEVVGLRWADVDLDGMSLSVSRARVRGHDGWSFGEPKTRAGRRRVDLDPATVEALRSHRAAQVVVPMREALVFDRGDGQPLDPDTVTGWFEAHRRRSALPRIRLHDLRHTAASLMLLAGVPAKVVQERLGHATVGITLDLYSHVAPTMQRDAADRLAALLA